MDLTAFWTSPAVPYLLVAFGAGIVVENLSPRFMNYFGLTADVLLEVNPQLVVTRMPAFGLDGPSVV
ncbi:CoA transferase [Mycobacterium uberis]|uniref:CoA transferase n=1 Tax=Mycobacterium uberis TaxID=2162698 RepID=UPI001FB3BFC1|nr:CoA transferase [Mycobacterium uberis]